MEPSLSKSLWIHKFYLTALHKAIYSATIKGSATTSCRRANYATAVPLTIAMNPLTELRAFQSPFLSAF